MFDIMLLCCVCFCCLFVFLVFTLVFWVKKKVGFVYFRFLKIFIPLYSVASVKPCSISGSASSIVLATLHIKSSDSVRNRACSRLMYIIVFLMFLCPSTYFTWIMSLVLWYSIVPL